MYLNKVFIKHPNTVIVSKKKLVCVFPFFHRKSLEIKKRLQNAIKRKLSYGIVYSFKYNCYNAIYYGKIKRPFYIRAAEHMEISHLTNKCLKNIKEPAISDHLLTCDCNINYNDFTILSNDCNNINFLIKESLLISYDNQPHIK